VILEAQISYEALIKCTLRRGQTRLYSDRTQLLSDKIILKPWNGSLSGTDLGFTLMRKTTRLTMILKSGGQAGGKRLGCIQGHVVKQEYPAGGNRPGWPCHWRSGGSSRYKRAPLFQLGQSCPDYETLQIKLESVSHVCKIYVIIDTGGQPIYKKGTGLVQLEWMGEQICLLGGGHQKPVRV